MLTEESISRSTLVVCSDRIGACAINDGRKLDHRALEVLRLRAVEQVRSGAHPEDVAEPLGLHRKTVYGWLARFRKDGRDALLTKPVPGRLSKLSGRYT